MKYYHSIQWFSFLYVIWKVSGKVKTENCNYPRNEYYSEATKLCRKCDPCPIGEGLQTKPINFKIDIVKGARECRICRQCENDTYQKRHKAFKKCKPCRTCKEGEVEVQKCTDRQNRKCKTMDQTYKLASSINHVTRNFMTTRDIQHKKTDPVSALVMAEPDSKVDSTTHLVISVRKSEVLQIEARRGSNIKKESPNNSDIDTGPNTSLTDIEDETKPSEKTTEEKEYKVEQETHSKQMQYYTNNIIENQQHQTKNKKEDIEYYCRNKRQHDKSETISSSSLPLMSTFQYHLSDPSDVSPLQNRCNGELNSDYVKEQTMNIPIDIIQEAIKKFEQCGHLQKGNIPVGIIDDVINNK